MTDTTTFAAPQLEEKTSRHDLAIIYTMLIATFVVILNETIMNVAIPKLMTEFSVDASTAQWLATAFMLVMAILIPTTGFLMQRFSTRTLFLAAMSTFSLGTLVAGSAPIFALLLVGRVLQASGTAIMLPLLTTTILTLIPAHRRGAMMGTVSIVISVAPAIGPTISGLIVEFTIVAVYVLFCSADCAGGVGLCGTESQKCGRNEQREPRYSFRRLISAWLWWIIVRFQQRG